jgi:hypothetical protein
MTAVLNTQGLRIIDLDAVNPPTWLTAGEGRSARLRAVEDFIAYPVTFGSAAANYARFCRIPANAKIKRFEVWFSASPDANATQQLALDFGIAFSDSTQDGTPSAYQGLIPTTVGTGATAGTLTTFAAYTTPNKLFGTLTLSGANVAPNVISQAGIGSIGQTVELTFNGVNTQYTLPLLTQTPVVSLFNFLDGRSVPIENLGWVDIYVYVSHAYATVPGAALTLFGRVEYID